ncbi:MAG: IS256 family transposase [Methanolinea sp.]|nr:IS256 family transposase [Methanolinea sp.]
MNSKDLVVNYLTDNEEGMRNVITWFLNEVMQREADELAGAGRYERTGSRRTYRNGTRSRSLKSRYGSLSLDKPLLRDIPFKTQVFERYSRVEKALENAIIESYLQGVSTRKIQDVIATLGVEKISASYVSSIAKDLDAKVIEFLSRPVESHIPYLFVDASYFKVRDGIKYTNKALLVIAGIRNDGIREILGARIADGEDELTWEDFFSELKDRGLRRVNLVISDGHKGIQNAVQRSFHGCSWQMCQVHFIRAVLKKIPRKDHKFVVAILKDSLNDPRRLQECIIELESRGFSRAAATIERFQYDVMNYRSFPIDHWKRIRTTNLLERVNKELKRRYRSIGAFPNDSSLLRIAGSILMDINEEWITSRRYLSDVGEISSADTGSEITAY